VTSELKDDSKDESRGDLSADSQLLLIIAIAAFIGVKEFRYLRIYSYLLFYLASVLCKTFHSTAY
jgi:hypothetical protein